MWMDSLSVWFFMQHDRWAFIYIILFRAYFIFAHRIRLSARAVNYVSVLKASRLFRFLCMLMLRYGWCEL